MSILITKDARQPTDMGALNTRIEAYGQFADHDINEVLDKELSGYASTQIRDILDVGCGTGKQSLFLARKYPQARILSLDKSSDAIAAIAKAGCDNITARVVDINSSIFTGTIDGQAEGYDLIVSFFAIYHSNDLDKTLRYLLCKLRPGGRLVLAGYSEFNNRELCEVLQKISDKKFTTPDFMSKELLASLFYGFVYSAHYFFNPLRFPAVESFQAYYRNYGLYDAELEPKVLAEVAATIAQTNEFTLSKVSLIVSVEKEPDNFYATHLPATLNSDKFFIRNYIELLHAFKENNFSTVSFGNVFSGAFEKTPKPLLLRHDVDLSADCALRMARIEAEAGITASYFFLVSGGFYNLITSSNRSIPREIRKMGHEIGLHFEDASTFKEDKRILEEILGEEINVYSQHNPTIDGFKAADASGMHNAYDPRISKELGFLFISDSGMKWRGKSAFAFMDQPRFYLLTHPESWFSQGSDLVQLIRSQQQQEINRVKRLYNEYVGKNIEYLYKRKSIEGQG